MPIFTGCSVRARIGTGAQTAPAVHARPALRMARRPIRRACGDAAFRGFGDKLSAPDQPDQTLVALACVGKARDAMCRHHRDRNQQRATVLRPPRAWRMRGVLLNRDDQTDLPSPIPRRRAGFSKTTRSASPNKSKEIQMELLGFPWIRWGRIGAFQWVRANPNKKIFPPAPSRKRPCQGPHDFRQPGQDNTDSVSDKELVSKDCRPLRRRGWNWKARTGDGRQRRRQTFPLWETWSRHRPRNVAHNRRCFAASIG
jgi:hypothetical protein